ncbi:hypothetical protein [Teredinibacter franksiae]
MEHYSERLRSEISNYKQVGAFYHQPGQIKTDTCRLWRKRP